MTKVRPPPDSSEACNQRGLELAERGWLEEALKEFDRAIQGDHQAPYPYLNRAGVYLEQGRLAEALQDLLAAVRLAPDDPVPHYQLGWFLSRHGSSIALAELQVCLDKDPEHLDSLIQLGVTRAERGELRQAEAHLQAALRIDPSDPIANHEFGALLLDQGRVHEAISHLRFAMEEMAGDREILLDLALAYQQAGFLEQARAILEDQVLKRDPADLHAHYHLAVLYIRREAVDTALAHLREASRQDPAMIIEWLREDPAFDTVRSDARFLTLLSAVKTVPHE